jgi:hypothetical protein
MVCLAQNPALLLAPKQATTPDMLHLLLQYTPTCSWIVPQLFALLTTRYQAIRQEEYDHCCALSCINISSKISIIEPCQQRLISFLSAEPKPPIAGTHHITENLLSHCMVILPWLLQKMTHIANSKCKIGTSIHQIPQTLDDALIGCGVHQRLRALLAHLQAGLHGYMAWIASYHATPLQNLHRISTLTKRNTARTLLHFNAEVVVKQAGDDEVIDVDPNHQLNVVIPSDVDVMFRRSPPKNE